MGFDQTYDEMLHNEFGSSGATLRRRCRARRRLTRSAARACAEVGAERRLHGSPSCRARRSHDASVDGSPPGLPRRRDPRRRGRAGPMARGRRGLSRYRNAAMVGAGGLTCAAIGAFLGGLGGYFTVNPAAAHPLASAAGPNQQLATAVDQAYRVASQRRLGGRHHGVVLVAVGRARARRRPAAVAHDVGLGQPLGLGSPATATSQPGLGAVGSGSGSGGLGLGLGCTTAERPGCRVHPRQRHERPRQSRLRLERSDRRGGRAPAEPQRRRRPT